MFRDLTIDPPALSPAWKFLDQFAREARPHPDAPLPYCRIFHRATVGAFALSPTLCFLDWWQSPDDDRGQAIAAFCDLADRHRCGLLRITGNAAMARLLARHGFQTRPIGDMWACLRNPTPGAWETAETLATAAAQDAARAREWHEQRSTSIAANIGRRATARRC